MSRGAHSFCMVVLLVFITSSCIKDTLPECPPQLVVKLVIKDTNYFNIAQFSELSPEDSTQPFTHFSGTICYILTNTTTGQIVRQSDIIVPVGNTPDFSPFLQRFVRRKIRTICLGKYNKRDSFRNPPSKRIGTHRYIYRICPTHNPVTKSGTNPGIGKSKG